MRQIQQPEYTETEVLQTAVDDRLTAFHLIHLQLISTQNTLL